MTDKDNSDWQSFRGNYLENKEKMKAKDDLVFTAYYINAEHFKRHFHTVEAYARRAKYKEVSHKLESGEVLKETRLDNIGG